jgi:hypothetical protein
MVSRINKLVNNGFLGGFMVQISPGIFALKNQLFSHY